MYLKILSQYLNREEQDKQLRIIKELDLSPTIHFGLNGNNPAKSLYPTILILRRSPRKVYVEMMK